MPSSLFALLDDIATLLDDVALLTKAAAQKTAGVVGDDLALNAQQVTGVTPDRELPVVYAVAKGSLVNKAILVPAALGVSTLVPGAVTPLMMLGGTYLCFEGVEKIAHKVLHPKAPAEPAPTPATTAEPAATTAPDLVALEREKIKGAIRTDFVLSAEIIVLSLGVVAGAPFAQRVVALALVGVAMTIGVYGLVAAIVKLDDLGLFLEGRGGAAAIVGRAIVASAPWLMRALSFAGTVAMFLVGGEILLHGLAPLHHAVVHVLPGGVLRQLATLLVTVAFGFLAGSLALALVKVGQRLRGR